MWWCHLQRWCGLVLLLIAPVALVSAASLFTAETMADGTLYSDSVARRQGDLITIMVQENTSVSEKNKTTAKRNNKLSAAVNVIPFSSETPQVSGASSAGRLPAVAAESAKNFQGQGDYEATGEVKATITGRVLDVLDNGNLLIEGRRAVRVNNDTKTILITGIIRTADIRSDNTVLSEKLHNFQVSIVGEGPLTRSQSEGFLGQIADIVWPF